MSVKFKRQHRWYVLGNGPGRWVVCDALEADEYLSVYKTREQARTFAALSEKERGWHEYDEDTKP